uniref:Uncharacterized protein n=1 Tax=Arundo donax TaxID=35708 RepID=A0A0A9E597_ARUDO
MCLRKPFCCLYLIRCIYCRVKRQIMRI